MLRRVRTRYISSSSAAKIKGNERAASSTPIEMLVVKTGSFILSHEVTAMRRMRTMSSAGVLPSLLISILLRRN